MYRNIGLSATLILCLFTPSAWGQVNEIQMPKADLKKAWFKNAKAGDFAEYGKVGATQKDYTRREEVLAVQGASISIRITISEMDGFARQQILLRYDFTGADASPAKGITLKTSEDKVKVAGKEYKCQLTERFKDGKLESKEWLSDEVPVMGRVKFYNAKTKEEIQLTKHSRAK